MIHSETFEPKTDRKYTILHDNNGNALHIYLYGGKGAVVYPTLFDLVCNVIHDDTEVEMFEVEHIDILHDIISNMYTYDYFAIKKEVESIKATTDLEKGLMHRLEMIKDEINQILTAIKSDPITESILKYTKSHVGANLTTHLYNIEIATDLKNDEAISWTPYNHDKQ